MKRDRGGWRPIVRLIVLGGLLGGFAAGCYAEPVAITTLPPTDRPGLTETTPHPQPTDASPTAAGSPATPGQSAVPAAICVNGWTSPAAGSAHYDDAVAVLNRQLDTGGSWQLDTLRYFTGPDVSWSDAPVDVVERWYVRGALAAEPNLLGRFLIERRSDLIGLVAAVAPYDSRGFQSPDWMGFFGDGQPTTYLGLPGQWSGTPYDFVSGSGYSDQPGLPDQVIGCLGDT